MLTQTFILPYSWGGGYGSDDRLVVLKFIGLERRKERRNKYINKKEREVVHVDDLSLQNDPARGKILTEAVLGNVLRYLPTLARWVSSWMLLGLLNRRAVNISHNNNLYV